MKKIYFLLLLMIAARSGLPQVITPVKIKVNATSAKSTKSFGIRGNLPPLSWENTLFLSDPDKDGIYEGELRFEIRETSILEFKFVYGDKQVTYELEGQNRILVLNGEEKLTDLVWNVPDETEMKDLPLLTAEQLSGDFEILRKALSGIHPGVYRYRTAAEVDSLFEHYRRVFSRPMSYRDAFLNFTRMTSFVQCGHTFPSFYNQNGLIRQVVLDQPDKLPFSFRVVDRRMVITENVSGSTDLPRGTEVLAIGGVSSEDFLAETAALVKADGANDAKRFADLNTFGIGGFYEAFDVYFPLLFPPQNRTYSLLVRKPGSQTTEMVKVNTLSRGQRTTRLMEMNADTPASADQLWHFEFWDNNTAFLQLGTFDVFQLTFEWDKFLKNAFSEIRKRRASKLVIDLRWNEGGQDEVLLALGRYLARKQLTIPVRTDLVRYTKVPEDIKPWLFTWDNSIFDLSDRAVPYKDGYFVLQTGDLPEIEPAPAAFLGDTYLLVNAANSSATFYFAEIAKENRLALLIGETTGGSQQGLNGGTMFFLRLPGSQIEIDIPVIGTFSTDKPSGGIVPDIPVTETPEDIAKGGDSVLRFVKEFVRK